MGPSVSWADPCPKPSHLCIPAAAFPIEMLPLEAAVKPCCCSALKMEGVGQRSHSLGPGPHSGRILLHCLRLPPRWGCFSISCFGCHLCLCPGTEHWLNVLLSFQRQAVLWGEPVFNVGLLLSTVRHYYVRGSWDLTPTETVTACVWHSLQDIHPLSGLVTGSQTSSLSLTPSTAAWLDEFTKFTWTI